MPSPFVRATGPMLPGEDPRATTRRTECDREAVLTGESAATRPVTSWRRLRWSGLDPTGAPRVPLLDLGKLLRRREASGLGQLLPLLRARLLPAAEAAGQLMVVVDAAGRVLWREGGRDVLRRADALGFLEGSAWHEWSVGTNAIGTSLVVGEPVHVHTAEHWGGSHQPWTCAAAPLHDPLSGRVLGAVDLSGPAHTVHASTVALVEAVARLAELEVRTVHEERLHRLRAVAAPVLARLPGRALVVGLDGTTAAASGLPGPARVTLPDALQEGLAWLPSLGRCRASALPGGWLLHLDEDTEPAVSQLVLDLTAVPPVVVVAGPSGSWTHTLTPRHAQLLLTLVRHPEGRTAAQLAEDLFGDPSRTVTVRAEVSRLRRTLGPLLAHKPYRVANGVAVDLRIPTVPAGPACTGSAAAAGPGPPGGARRLAPVADRPRCAAVPSRAPDQLEQRSEAGR